MAILLTDYLGGLPPLNHLLAYSDAAKTPAHHAVWKLKHFLIIYAVPQKGDRDAAGPLGTPRHFPLPTIGLAQEGEWGSNWHSVCTHDNSLFLTLHLVSLPIFNLEDGLKDTKFPLRKWLVIWINMLIWLGGTDVIVEMLHKGTGTQR